jgi:hypothetical protein
MKGENISTHIFESGISDPLSVSSHYETLSYKWYKGDGTKEQQ